MTRRRVETAPAKINLCLHVLGRRDDGYHEIESLAVFAETGDRLVLSEAETDAFAVTGPFAAALAGGDNLVLRARDALRKSADFPPVSIALEKCLPVASGMGGGSADAAAALRGLSGLFGLEPAGPKLAAGLGADVPVCLGSRPAWMTGRGEGLRPIAPFPRVAALLVNPGVAVETGRVFAALDLPSAAPCAPGLRKPSGFADADALLTFLAETRNDLEAPARRLAPAIGEVLAALDAAPGCRFARMSGSGATCFGLFASAAAARDAAAAIARARPGWWCRPTRLGADVPAGSGEASP